MAQPENLSQSDDACVNGIDVGNIHFATRLRSGLADTETLMTELISDGEDFMAEVALHLMSAGGKRFRPLVTLLCAQFGPHPDNADVIKVGAVSELIHLATLYHDDVMDEAMVRRSADSANARWGNNMAILAGDYLFARSSQLLAQLGSEAVQHYADTFAELVTGQMREGLGARDGDIAQHYLDTIWEKTGTLIATAGRMGARFAGASEDTVKTVNELCVCIGMAFQIADDIIDIESPTGQSGKTPGTDVREGVRTLPMIFVEQSEESPRLTQLLNQTTRTDAEVEEALNILRASEGMRRAKETLKGYVEKANACLDQLPQADATFALRQLVDFTVVRAG